MKAVQAVIAAAILASGLYGIPLDVRTTSGLIKKGNSLSASDAGKLEERLNVKPDDQEARIQLLAYYTVSQSAAALPTVKAARAKHILWLVQNDPKDGLGLFHAETGVYRVHCQGDTLADPDAFKRVADIWVEQVKKNPGNADIRRNAVSAIQFCAPERAEQMLTEAKDTAGLGRLYGAAVLGISGQSYLDNDLSGSDPALRESSFAKKAQQVLEQTTDKDLLVAAARTLLRDGATMWADGKLDWDYTAIGNSILAKAKSVGPDEYILLTLPTTLPERGERPPMTIRVGSAVQAANLVQQPSPRYPPDARARHIQGVVKMTALIGLDGKVMYLRLEGGPPELVPGTLEAVRQWEYKRTLMNGKPCYVVTRIDVNYTLSAP